MAVQIQLRRGTASQWTATNPTLSQGEMGLETDTYKIKIGDGTTAWNSLAYYNDGGVISVGATSPVASSGGTSPVISMPAATTSVSGYLTSTDWTTFNNKGSGSVTSVAATPGTGISITGSPITTSGTLNITNTAPDQTVVLNNGTGISVTGTYPNFTIINTSPSSGGTVTSVTGTSPVNSSGGTTPAISLAGGYGDTLNPYASKTANYVLAAPDGAAGVPTFRAIVATDIPTLNQNTTGTASNITATSNSTLTTLSSLSLPGSQVTGNISGNATNVTGTVAIVNGGTGATTAPTARSNLNAAQSGANTDITSIALTTGTITTTPSSNTDIANKSYVDTVAQGLDTKASVVAGTTVNITLSGTQTIDGVVLVAGDRVLVKNQTLPANNGLYLCAAGAWTRTTDMDTWAEVPGAYVFVETGSTLADTGWVCTSDAGGTIGVTAITWTQFSGVGSGVSSITFGSTGLTPATATTGAVTVAGTLALTNGGTGQTTAGAAFNALSPITTTGDLIIGNGTNNATRLAIGASTYVLTSNGTTATWSASTGGVTSVTATSPVASTGGATPDISMPAATTSVSGYLTSTDWTTFNNKGSGTVTSVGGTGTVSGISLSGTVTSSGNLTLGGTLDLSSPPTIGNTTANTGKFTTLESTGTASLATGSTTSIQIVGDASYPQVLAAGGTNTPLVLQPLGTGALQAQKPTSTTVGGNVRGANAVDWQTLRTAATHVASGGAGSTIGGGQSNTVTGGSSVVAGGQFNAVAGFAAVIVGGTANTATLNYTFVGGGTSNTAAGYYSVIGGGYINSGTASAAVTTQSATMNGTTAVTLSGSNASIKVGQFITGTSISNNTYVAAISGTSLTLSQVASGSTTNTLNFFTPHGVVVGGGNNQATGSFSFIGGGGDAGTATNRNTASGDWSVVGGGSKNVASGIGSVVAGGGLVSATSVIQGNTASGTSSFVGAGTLNLASGTYAFIGAGAGHSATGFGAAITSGNANTASGSYTSVIGGQQGTSRAINGNVVFTGSVSPVVTALGASQSAILVLGRQTTDATATVIPSDVNAASGSNQVTLPNNSAYAFKAMVIAGVTGAGNTASWTLEGSIKRGANAASTVIVGTVTTVRTAYDAGASTWAVTATADTTNGALAFTVTGQAATTIRWVCKVETTEMTY